MSAAASVAGVVTVFTLAVFDVGEGVTALPHARAPVDHELARLEGGVSLI